MFIYLQATKDSIFPPSSESVARVATESLMTLGASGRRPIYGSTRGDKFTIIAVVAGRRLQQRASRGRHRDRRGVPAAGEVETGATCAASSSSVFVDWCGQTVSSVAGGEASHQVISELELVYTEARQQTSRHEIEWWGDSPGDTPGDSLSDLHWSEVDFGDMRWFSMTIGGVWRSSGDLLVNRGDSLVNQAGQMTRQWSSVILGDSLVTSR